MITFEEADKIVKQIAYKPEIEEIQTIDSLGRVLAQYIISKINMPPFDKSAMDGYALASKDNSDKFQILETISAGSLPSKKIKKGQCSKIMTGAKLPPGADKVVMVEKTEEKNGYMKIIEEDARLNICYLGEDIKIGDVILDSGHLIRPQEVGIIASMGLKEVKVFKKPKVGIITTGTEIVEPGFKLNEGQIYNSNSYSLSAQVLETGAEVLHTGIITDNREEIKKTISSLLSETNMILISGGVSMGDYDFVPGVLQRLGVHIHYSKVAIKPGKPTVFGTKNSTVIFGLPGNPVSTFVIFEVFVKQVLYKLMGYNYTPQLLKGKLAEHYRRKRYSRTSFIPVIYKEDGFVEPVKYHGSAHLNSLSEANALLKIPAGVKEVSKGSEVHVRQI
jgi:molybdopterin molybdotransferase